MTHSKFKLLIFFLTGAALASCKKDLVSYNKNPDVITSVSPGFLLSDALLTTTGVNNNTGAGVVGITGISESGNIDARFNYCHAFMQYGYSSFWSGTAYVYSDPIGASYWGSLYQPVLTDLTYLIPSIKNQAQYATTYAAARIWRVFIFQKLTDFYGDIPYFQVGVQNEAGTAETYTPVYDHQQQIYSDLINELRQSMKLLETYKSQTVLGDQFYNGSATQWKKLAASILLRIGMRLVKVDPAMAATLASEAVDDGVMQSNADMPVLMHTSLISNGIYTVLHDGVEHFFLHQTLVTHMQATADPRLQYYGAEYSDQVSRGGVVKSNNASKYVGSDFTGGNSPNVRIRADIFGLTTTPFFDFPYAEVELLQSEAILRGYIAGDANAHFAAGVASSMQSLSLLPGGAGVSTEQINTYLANNPLNGTVEQQIAQVNTEFWVAAFAFDADEEWANWRRTGYPALVPNPGSVSKTIPRKMPYPQSEFNLNSVNVNAALAAYGGQNTFNPKARVWWDPL